MCEQHGKPIRIGRNDSADTAPAVMFASFTAGHMSPGLGATGQRFRCRDDVVEVLSQSVARDWDIDRMQIGGFAVLVGALALVLHHQRTLRAPIERNVLARRSASSGDTVAIA
jgi:hypothetical protein